MFLSVVKARVGMLLKIIPEAPIFIISLLGVVISRPLTTGSIAEAV